MSKILELIEIFMLGILNWVLSLPPWVWIFLALILVGTIIEVAIAAAKYILVIALLVGAVILCIKFRKAIFIIIAAGIVFLLVSKAVKKIRNKLRQGSIISDNRKWLKSGQRRYTEDAIDSIMYQISRNIESIDTNNKDHKFTKYNMPYGRASVFLGYFKTGIEDNEIYYYSCWPSKIEEEIREYGLLIARSGIYVSVQQKKEDGYVAENCHIPFEGLKTVAVEENKIIGKNINCQTLLTETHIVILPGNITDIDAIKRICECIIDTGISRFMSKRQKEYVDHNIIAGSRKFFQKNSGVNIPYDHISHAVKEFKNYMNGRQGGGYAAEYANNIIDRLRGKKVINAGQILDENGRQRKNGADRIVNSVEIQTKYYKTGKQSVDAAFENGTPKYIRSDGSGKMMQIEVPRDFYQEALERMQEKINSGVLKVEPGESAKDYVRRGNVTYRQAQNIACAGRIESLKMDALGGIQCTVPGAVVSMLVVFAQMVWNGEDVRKAACNALESGIEVTERDVITYVGIMQLKRAAGPQLDALAKKMVSSDFAETSLGKMLGVDKVNGQQLATYGGFVVVEFGPDLCRAAFGKISFAQLMKNSIIKVADMGGSLMINSLIPSIPVFESIALGSFAHFYVKKIMDNFIEDDAVKMYRILKEEYLEAVALSGLNKEELQEVINITVCSEKLPRILRNMYASGECRTYARYAIMDEAIIQILSRRKKISNEDFYTAVRQLVRLSEE